MRNNIQSFLLAAGNLGAEALCIIKLAEEKVKSGIDVMSALQAGIDKKYLKVDEKNLSSLDNFEVKEPALYLEYLSGWNCGIKEEVSDYKPKDGELIVECWKRGKDTHFKLPDWDPLENSFIVKYGTIDSLIVFYPLKNKRS